MRTSKTEPSTATTIKITSHVSRRWILGSRLLFALLQPLLQCAVPSSGAIRYEVPK
jgi:hypothetical protein